MQLSSGIPEACGHVYWQFRPGMMLCNCQVEFLRHAAMCAGDFDQVWCYATVKWNFWGIQLCVLAIMMLCNCQVEFLGHLAVCAGNF